VLVLYFFIILFLVSYFWALSKDSLREYFKKEVNGLWGVINLVLFIACCGCLIKLGMSFEESKDKLVEYKYTQERLNNTIYKLEMDIAESKAIVIKYNEIKEIMEEGKQ